MKIRSLVACVFAFAALPAAAQSNPKGTLFIVGGGPQPKELVEQFVDLAGGRGKARIVVFAEASEDGAKSGDEKVVELQGYGATALNVWVTHDQANTDSVAKLLDGATGVWFGGGDQVKLTGVL